MFESKCPNCGHSVSGLEIRIHTGLRDDGNQEELLVYCCPNCYAVLGCEMNRLVQMDTIAELIAQIHEHLHIG